MSRDTTSSFGVTKTIVKNLTGDAIFASWWPEKHGEGRVLQPYEKVQFNGNLFEALYAWPKLKVAMEADVQAGKVAISRCGAVKTVEPYPVVVTQPHPEFHQFGCIDWEYDSSSSAWIEG